MGFHIELASLTQVGLIVSERMTEMIAKAPVNIRNALTLRSLGALSAPTNDILNATSDSGSSIQLTIKRASLSAG